MRKLLAFSKENDNFTFSPPLEPCRQRLVRVDSFDFFSEK